MDDTSRKNLAANSATFGTEGNLSDQTGVSIFDPVLTEICYSWFSPIGAKILDPFAGGSVRGVVASMLDRKYTGIDLRSEQVDANNDQGKILCSKENMPKWICGDSLDQDLLLDNEMFDLVFTCPPYADLEVYSDNPKDISTMSYDKFINVYREIIKKSCDRLNENRFACIVVGEVRNKKTGGYRNFIGDTVMAFIDAGLTYYNEMILVTAVGSLPLRAGKSFESGRKIGKTHQNILVFVKGDFKKATQFCGPCKLDFNIASTEQV